MKAEVSDSMSVDDARFFRNIADSLRSFAKCNKKRLLAESVKAIARLMDEHIDRRKDNQ